MKKNLFILALLMVSVNVFSQIKEGDILLNFNGSYEKTSKITGIPSNNISSIEKSLDLGASFKYFISNHFLMGLGIDYYQLKEEGTITQFNQSDDGRTSLIRSELNAESKAALPAVYIGYYKNIVSKLFFSSTLKVAYGTLKTDVQSFAGSRVVAGYQNMLSNIGPASFPSWVENKKSDLLNAKLSPELNYFISDRWSLGLGLGGVQYSSLDGETDNANWSVNFEPKNWTFGVGFKL
ncbi:hypothetical protein EYV94_23340 [Puteibacter caeruleilacunae]|nr:hypothetical protein EYV94_23340 [Puteibacter caeruleilacunae]